MLSYILRHACGFFMQIGPCVLLSLTAFSKEEFRWGRRKTFSWFILLNALFSAGFGFFMSAMSRGRLSSVSAADLYFGAVVLAAALFILMSVSAPLIRKMIAFSISVEYVFLVYVCVNMLLYIRLFPKLSISEYGVYDYQTLLFYFIFTALILPPMLLLMQRTVRPYFLMMQETDLKKDFIILALLTVVLIAAVSLTDIYLANDALRAQMVPLYMLDVLFLFVIYSVVYWLLFYESIRLRKRDETASLLEIQDLRYEELQANIENTRRVRHDTKHIYRAILTLLDEGRVEEAKELAGAGESRITRLEMNNFCGDRILNALLQYYYAEAAEKHINIEISADPGRSFAADRVDLSLILGNMLENAIRSCLSCPEGAFIRLNIVDVHGNTAIYMENSCRNIKFSPIKSADHSGWLPASAFLTTKEKGGSGLGNISRIAASYAGVAEFRYEEPVFSTRVCLQGGKPHEEG